jgi:hypothetical protein
MLNQIEISLEHARKNCIENAKAFKKFYFIKKLLVLVTLLTRTLYHFNLKLHNQAK